MFGTQLARLAEARGFDRATLARRASWPEAEIASVLDGAEPGPALLHRLAPALGLHRSDLFVIAGRPVAFWDPAAGRDLGSWAGPLMFLPRAAPELLELVRSLPRRPRPAGVVPSYHSYPDAPGGLVLRLLHNRNLDWLAAAKFLHGMGGGPVLSAATIGAIGHGRKALTPDLLAGLGAVLDIAPADLGVLTGIDPSAAGVRIHPEAGTVAELIWDARRLTGEQLNLVRERAHEMRHERAEELDPRRRCGCADLS